MVLSPGDKLGPYEIVSAIGAGGMGEVYRARDTRLDRIVAVKVMSAEFRERPDRRQRFQTEARAISSLNHPHICTLFDVGEQDGAAFLVMEYLEGETLDDRLSAGPLTAADVLRFACQIADALDHAHRERIVHRDLKPSNVMLTASGPKLLDFGLARGPIVNITASRESTAALPLAHATAEGTILGTLQYMAPEQLEGKAADARTDIFALGTLIFEMATGRKAFEGASHASLIASILTGQPPPVSSTRPSSRGDLPPGLDHVVDRCLAKNPEQRWQTARDAKLELEWIGSDEQSSRSLRPAKTTARWRETVAWAVAAIGIAAAIAVIVMKPQPAPKQATRFVVAPPAGTTIGTAENRTRIALSPDGRKLAFIGTTEGKQQLWVQTLDSLTAQAISGTEGAVSPFWSPDSEFVGFFSPGEGAIKKVASSGGPAMLICVAEMDGAPNWGADGTILFTLFRDGIHRVRAEGGTPTPVTRIDKDRRELNHYWPTFLPDGQHFVYMATARDDKGLRSTPTTYVASLTSSEVKPLRSGHSRMLYSPPDQMLFAQDGVLLSQTLNLSSLQLEGEPVVIAEGVSYYRTLGNTAAAVSTNGVLAYLGSEEPSEFSWYDRAGREDSAGWPTQDFGTARISPDARSVAVDVKNPRTGTADIWIYDIARGVPTPFTSDLSNQSQPVWSPDQRRVLYRDDRSGSPHLRAQAFDGREEVLVQDPGPLSPDDWSADGKWIVYDQNTRSTGVDLWLLPLSDKGTPRPFLNTGSEEFGGRFSPDSAWIAFVSGQFGSPEVYVAPIGEPGARKRVSVGGGTSPRWRKDGKELFYISGDDRSMMAVSIDRGRTTQIGLPKRLFNLRVAVSRDRARNTTYDVTPDGERFLVNHPIGEPGTSRISVVMNWQATLAR